MMRPRPIPTNGRPEPGPNTSPVLAGVLLAALALVAAACASPADQEPPDVTPGAETPAGETPAGETPQPPSDGGETVILDDIAFQQNDLAVAPGTTVEWRNEDAVGHTVTHGEDGSPAPDPLFDEPVASGGTVTFTFEEPGSYPVTCTIHPQMNMTVAVE